MRANCVDSCVIAVPSDETYRGLPMKAVVNRYNNMSTTEFEKQFETKDEIKYIKSEIAVGPCGKKRICRTLAPFTRFDKWHGTDARQSMMGSLIYTKQLGLPIAEYCAIRNRNPDEISIDKDTAKFYKEHGWDARIYYDGGNLMRPFNSNTFYAPYPYLHLIDGSVMSELSKTFKKSI